MLIEIENESDNEYLNFEQQLEQLPRQDKFVSDCSSLVNLANQCIENGANKTKTYLISYLKKQGRVYERRDNFSLPAEPWCQALALIPLLFQDNEKLHKVIKQGSCFDEQLSMIHQFVFALDPVHDTPCLVIENLQKVDWSKFRSHKLKIRAGNISKALTKTFIKRQFGGSYASNSELIDQIILQNENTAKSQSNKRERL